MRPHKSGFPRSPTPRRHAASGDAAHEAVEDVVAGDDMAPLAPQQDDIAFRGLAARGQRLRAELQKRHSQPRGGVGHASLGARDVTRNQTVDNRPQRSPIPVLRQHQQLIAAPDSDDTHVLRVAAVDDAERRADHFP